MSPTARVSVSDLELAPVTHSPPRYYGYSGSHPHPSSLPTHMPIAVQKNPTLAPHIPPDGAVQGPSLLQVPTYSRPKVFARGYFRATVSARGSITLVVVQSMDWEAFRMKTTLEQRWMATNGGKCYSRLLGWNKGTGEPQLSVRFHAQNAYPALLGEDRSYIDAFETILLYNKHIVLCLAPRSLSSRPLQDLI
jgi:hypothetical protein